MKLLKSSLFLLILLISFQIDFGQEKPKAELIDEFGKMGCDELLARIQNFAAEMEKNPAARGYVLTSGKKDKFLQNYRRGQLIKDALLYLKRDVSRYVFNYGEESSADVRTQFWMVPAGADDPALEKNSDHKLEIDKPIIFLDTREEIHICPPDSDFELSSKLLISNPALRGNLVIYERTRRKFRQTEKKLLKKLVDDYKVPGNKLKTFYVKDNFSGIELWLVPRKKK